MQTLATPELETGWGAQTPAQDTVLRRGVLALAAAWACFATSTAHRVAEDARFRAVDLGRANGFFNSATLLRPMREDEFQAAVDDIERFYASSGSGSVLLWSPWPTPDLTERGWRLQGHPPLLFRPAGSSVEPWSHVRRRIDEVATPAALAAWNRSAVDAFPLLGVETPADLLDPGCLGDPRVRLTVAREAERDVGVGCQAVVHDTNVLVFGAVPGSARGRGHYGALVADRLARTPRLPAVTIVSDDSRPILVERFGFLPISRFTLWERPRP